MSTARHRIERREALGTSPTMYRLFADDVAAPRQIMSMHDFEWQFPVFAQARGTIYQIVLRIMSLSSAPLWIMPFEERDEDAFNPWIVLIDPPVQS